MIRFECDTFGMWDICDVVCLAFGMFRLLDVWDVRYSRCEMLRMWDVRMWDVGDARYLGCGML